MTPEDKAHFTSALGPPSLLCHLKLRQRRGAFAHGFLFSRTVPSAQTGQRQTDKQAERHEAISTLSRGAAGCWMGRALKWFSGQLIGLI